MFFECFGCKSKHQNQKRRQKGVQTLVPIGLPRLPTKCIMASLKVRCSGVEISVMKAAMPILGTKQQHKGLIKRYTESEIELEEKILEGDRAARKSNRQVDREQKKLLFERNRIFLLRNREKLNCNLWPRHEMGIQQHSTSFHHSEKVLNKSSDAKEDFT